MTISRILSLAVSSVGIIMAAVQFQFEQVLDYCIFVAVALALIWFPEAIAENAMGSWVDDYTIDNPTPPVMIGAFGWIALLAVDATVFWIL